MRLRRRDAGTETLRWCRDVVGRVNDLGPRIDRLDNDELSALTVSYRGRVARGEPLDDLLPEAFATVREAASRALGERPWDTQVMGAAVLHRGQIAEMFAGEGKTLAIVLPAYLHSLTGQGVHVMTASDHLAYRDAHWMRPVYQALGLTVGLVQGSPAVDFAARRKAHAADVTYGRATEFAHDYLRDNLARNRADLIQRGQRSALVDEADLTLLDEAQHRPKLAHTVAPPEPGLTAFATLAALLRPGEHYKPDGHTRTVSLTDSGTKAAEDYFDIDSLYSERNAHLVPYLLAALNAKEHYQRNRDYLVSNGTIVLIDHASGCPAPGLRNGDGTDEAIAAREGLDVAGEEHVLATVFVWDYLVQYERLAGITGTVSHDAEAYRQVYRRDVVTIPPHRPVIRVDHADAVYSNREAKLAALADEVASRHATGQPVLIGALSTEDAHSVAGLLDERNVDHQLLTTLHHSDTERIISGAGALGAVTVVSTMAGRGVGTPLGGADGAERDQVASAGGLCVLGTGRPWQRRLEMHLRGRAGRRGEPGESKFYLSWDDELVTRYLGAKTISFSRRLSLPEGQSIDRLSTTLTGAQASAAANEAKSLVAGLQWGNVLSAQYRALLSERAPALRGDDLSDWILTLISRVQDPARGFTQEAYQQREAELGRHVTRQLEQQVTMGVLDRCWRTHLPAMAGLMAACTVRGTGTEALAQYQSEADRLFHEMLEKAHLDIVGYVFTLDPLPEVSVVMVVEQSAGGLPDGGVVVGEQGDDQAGGE